MRVRTPIWIFNGSLIKNRPCNFAEALQIAGFLHLVQNSSSRRL
jgi:hypothetical protein